MKNGKKSKDKKKKKKKGKDKKESEEEVEEEEDQTPSVLVSRNAEMPEGYVSDGKFQFKSHFYFSKLNLKKMGVKCLATNVWRQMSETPKRASNVLASDVTVVKCLGVKCLRR